MTRTISGPYKNKLKSKLKLQKIKKNKKKASAPIKNMARPLINKKEMSNFLKINHVKWTHLPP